MIPSLALLFGVAWGGETRHVLVEPGLGIDVEIVSTEAGGFRWEPCAREEAKST